MDSLPTTCVDELVAAHQDFVRSLARGLARTLPRHVDFEDLVAYGQVGLLEAAQRYEHGHSTAFTTFAYYRVRGAIFDGLRKLQGCGAALGSGIVAAERADDLLEDGIATSDAAERLADELGDAVDRVTTAAFLAGHADEVIAGASPASCAEQRELVERLRRALEQLSSDDRGLLAALYHEGRSMTDVARLRGRHKATTCRAHQRIIETLRRELERSAEPDCPSPR